MCGPVGGDPSWQARAGEGFDIPNFEIDWAAQTATSCFTALLVKVGAKALIILVNQWLESAFVEQSVYLVWIAQNVQLPKQVRVFLHPTATTRT